MEAGKRKGGEQRMIIERMEGEEGDVVRVTVYGRCSSDGLSAQVQETVASIGKKNGKFMAEIKFEVVGVKGIQKVKVKNEETGEVVEFIRRGV